MKLMANMMKPFVMFAALFCLTLSLIQMPVAHMAGGVTLTADTTAMTATISNEYLTVKFNNTGKGYSLVYGSQELIGTAKGFYWDNTNNSGTNSGLSPTQLKIVSNTGTMADIAYIGGAGELHYVVRSGVSGIYSYFVAANVGTVQEMRTVYRVDGSIFRNGYNAERQGALPAVSDIQNGTLVQNETWKLPNGSYYSKYDWASYMAQDHIHGVYGTASNGNNYGVWMIPVSHEADNGGPLNQELMVHVESSTGDGTVLNMMQGTHLGKTSTTIPSGKMYGPWLVYVNNGDISDAKTRAAAEEASWPYSWLSNQNYPLNRSTVTGTLKVADGRSAAGSTIVLAQPGGEFLYQGTNYMYWAQTDSSGKFNIPNVRPGTYSLYAYQTGGSMTDQLQKDNIAISGTAANLGTITWTPPNYPNKLWQIGTADRKSGEFNLGNFPRQFGIYNNVPANLTYTIGTSSPSTNWYYAQTQAGQWNVDFNLAKTYSGNAHLTVAMAAISRFPIVEVDVNGVAVTTLDYSGLNDQTIYRDALQSGRYKMVQIDFPASQLAAGSNTITFKMTSVTSGGGIMYDTIKLETD